MALGALALTLVSPAEQAFASPEGLRACTQIYSRWISDVDAKLRRPADTVTAGGTEGEWCVSDPKIVPKLKAQLFSLDSACTDVTAEERQGLVKLVTQTLRSFQRVSACPPGVTTQLPQVVATPNPQSKPQSPPPPPQVMPQPKPVAEVKPAPPQVSPQLPPPQKKAPLVTAEVRPRVDPANPEIEPKLPATFEEPAKPKPKPPAPEARVLKPKSVEVAVVPPRAPASAPRRLETQALAEPQAPMATAPTRVAPPPMSSMAPPPSPKECLVVRQLAAGSYIVDVSACGRMAMRASIEIYNSNRGAECVRHVLDQDLPMSGRDMKAPEINFQCRADEAGCTEEALRQMFPECRDS